MGGRALAAGLVLAAAACGGDERLAPPDASPPDARAAADALWSPWPNPLIELPLLENTLDPTLPYDNGAETTVAVVGDTVVVAFINLHRYPGTFIDADDGRPLDPIPRYKHVGVAVSHNRGSTWSAVDPGGGELSTDPVVRAAPDGTFWLATLEHVPAPTHLLGHMATSRDGLAWERRVAGVPGIDKEWIAPGAQAVYLGASGGYWSFTPGGAPLGQTSERRASVLGAQADVDGAQA